MTKFYFIRHGKTQWNLERRYQGAGGDSPLLPESIAAIHELADYLKDVHFDHAYVSPLPRTRATARVLIDDMGIAIPLTVDDAFKEFNLGKLEGMTFERQRRSIRRSVMPSIIILISIGLIGLGANRLRT